MDLMQMRVERRMVPHVPWGVVLTALVLALIGIWNLASAARPPHTPVWKAQLAYLGISVVAMGVVAALKFQFLQRIALPFYVVNLLALVALRFVGHTAKGAESWFNLGPLRIQPAEFMKIGLILMMAKFFHDDFRPSDDRYGFLRLVRPALIAAVPTVLVLAQPDLGTAMMLGLTSLTLLLFARVRWPVAVVLVTGLLTVSVVIWNDYVRKSPPDQPHATLLRHRLKKHQSARISGWLDPESDLRGTNYHSAQSKIAVGSGGLTGKGWQKGTQTGLSFLPEQHTDFIFSVWAEEQGFLACVGLLALYAMLLLYSLGVASQARDRFGAFIAVGVTAMLFWQVFENIGMVIGLLPVTGITLPLLSYGGSSMLSVMMSLGLLVNIAMRRHMF